MHTHLPGFPQFSEYLYKCTWCIYKTGKHLMDIHYFSWTRANTVQIPEPQHFSPAGTRSLNRHKHLQALRFFVPTENSLNLTLWCRVTSSSLLCNAARRAFVCFSWCHFCIRHDQLFGKCRADNTNASTILGLVETSNVKFSGCHLYIRKSYSVNKSSCVLEQ